MQRKENTTSNYINFDKEQHIDHVLISIVCFLGTLLWAIYYKHLIIMYQRGYLNYFGIYSTYEIDSTFSSTAISVFFLLVLYFFSLFIIPYSVKILHKNPKKGNWKYFYHIIIYTFIDFLIMLILLTCGMNIIIRADLIYIVKNIISNFGIELVFLNMLFAIMEAVIEFSFFSSSPTSLTSCENGNKENGKILKMILPCCLLGLCFLICFADSFFLSLGEMSVSLKTTFPSFQKDNDDYIVIAKMDDGDYLTVLLPPKQESDYHTTYIIQDISDVLLIDKDIDGIFDVN